jgi:hypothetical protein
MALTFTTGMTEISDADSLTDWSVYKITAGGASPTLSLEANLKKEGTNSIGIIPTRNKDCGMIFNYYNANGSTVLDLTTVGNEVIQAWILSLSNALVETFANGGLYIIITAADAVPTTSNKWAKWYVGGSDNHPEGWTNFLVDTRKTPSATNGGWTYATDAPNTYRIGIGCDSADVTAWKAENLYVDRMAYGRPIYTLKGDGVLTADWADFLSHADTEVNGLIQDINGSYELSCGIQFGDDAQTATTTFSDATSQALNFKRHTYYNSGEVDALTYSDYYKITAEGAASFNTSVTLGSLIGSDEGILGGTIKSLDPTNVPVDIDFNTDQAHISALNIYGVTFTDITGNIDLGANSAFNYFSCFFVGCDQIDANGACEIRNCNFIDTSNADASLLWNASIDIQDCRFISNTTGAGIEHESGATATYTKLYFSGNTFDVLNSTGSAMTITKAGTPQSDPTTSEGSSVTFVGSVDITITVYDKEDGLVEAGVQTAVYKTSDRTQLLNEDTNASGIADDVYTGSTPVEIEVRCRKASSGADKFKNYSSIQTLGSSGLTLSVTMERDPNNNATT